MSFTIMVVPVPPKRRDQGGHRSRVQKQGAGRQEVVRLRFCDCNTFNVFNFKFYKLERAVLVTEQ